MLYVATLNKSHLIKCGKIFNSFRSLITLAMLIKCGKNNLISVTTQILVRDDLFKRVSNWADPLYLKKQSM